MLTTVRSDGPTLPAGLRGSDEDAGPPVGRGSESDGRPRVAAPQGDPAPHHPGGCIFLGVYIGTVMWITRDASRLRLPAQLPLSASVLCCFWLSETQ